MLCIVYGYARGEYLVFDCGLAIVALCYAAEKDKHASESKIQRFNPHLTYRVVVLVSLR